MPTDEATGEVLGRVVGRRQRPALGEMRAEGGLCAVRVNDEFTVDMMPFACGPGWSELSAFVEQRSLGAGALAVLFAAPGVRAEGQTHSFDLKDLIGDAVEAWPISSA
jgi:hypothetical protein